MWEKLSKRLVSLFVGCSSVVVIAQDAAWSLTLPTPTGPYVVGTRTFVWEDTTRREGATSNPLDYRRVPVQIWYPAAGNAASDFQQAPYYERPEAYTHLWGAAFVDTLRHVVPAARWEAPISDAEGTYPLAVFSHGWEASSRSHTMLLEALASYGYIVVGVNHPYMGRILLPDGTVTQPTEDHFTSLGAILAHYGADVRFAIDQMMHVNVTAEWLMEKVDPGHVAVAGHSSGFLAVVGACSRDTRIQACINFDSGGLPPDVLAGMQQPLLWLSTEQGGSPPEAFLERATRSVYEVHIEHATHRSFQDWAYLEARTEEGRQAAHHVLRQIETFTVAFLHTHLRATVHRPSR